MAGEIGYRDAAGPLSSIEGESLDAAMGLGG